MSKKRKLESLQQLGILKASEVKQVQARLDPTHRVVPYYITAATVRWTSLAAVMALAYGSLAIIIGVAWRLSH
jgi:hypothetical protein